MGFGFSCSCKPDLFKSCLMTNEKQENEQTYSINQENNSKKKTNIAGKNSIVKSVKKSSIKDSYYNCPPQNDDIFNNDLINIDLSNGN